MRYPFWKLIPLLGIPSFGCLVLLQVQKDLASGATAQAAEAAADAPVEPDSTSVAKPQPVPAGVPLAAIPDEAPSNPFDAVESTGLDFRLEMPAGAADGESPARTASADLKPILEGQAEPADNSIVAEDPFAAVREGDSPMTSAADEPLPVIQPAGFEKTAEAPAGAAPASDFGPDPFADLAPLAPNPHASGLEERPEPMEPASPSDLLDAEDPFAEPGAAEPTTEESVPSESESAPLDTRAPAGDPASAVGDDPFGDHEPPIGAEPAPAEGPAAIADTASEPEPSDAPAAVRPAGNDEPVDESAATPSDDPFDTPPAGPESGVEEDLGSAETPADEPAAAEPSPSDTPADSRPRPLPADEFGDSEDQDLGGTGTVSPTDPTGPQHARLTVEKKAPATANLGEPLVYEVLVTNVGDSPARDVTISDLIPKGTRLEGTIPRAEQRDQSLVWKLDTLEPRRSAKIRIKVTPVEPGPVGSVATVNFVSEAAAQTNVIAPHLSLKITAPPQVALGQPVDFRFEIANRGTAPAEKVLLRDVLPEGFQHPRGKDLEYEIGTVPPGESQAVTLRTAAVKAGSFTNTAVITAAGGLKSEAAADVEVADQAVSVTRQGPKRRYVGRPAMYSNVVRNGSDQPVRGVKVVEQVPQGMEFVSATHGGQFDPDKRTIAWQIPALGPGQEQSLQVTLTAAAEGVQDSTVRVEATGGRLELTSSTTVQGTPSLAPAIQSPDGPVAVGERAAYRIRIRNRGDADATAVAVSLGLPPNLNFVEAEGGQPRPSATGVTVRLPQPLPPGGEHEVVFIVEGNRPGPARVHAEVAAAHMAQPLVRDEELTVSAPAP